MFLVFTPFRYFFLRVYLIVLSILFSISHFYVFWLYIEVLILLFIGFSYTIFSNSYTQLMLYFLIQTLASFRILVFYILDYRSLFCMFLFLKLGMFPFFSWYVNVLYRFPSSLLLLSGTLHKLPPLLLLAIVVSSSNISLLVVTRLVTLMVGGFFILRVLDFRYLLVVSSIANNSFLILGIVSGSYSRFFIFYALYFITIAARLYVLDNFMKVLSPQPIKGFLVIFITFLLLNMAALPPLPMFLAKFLLIYEFLLVHSSYIGIVVLVVLANVSIVVSYCQLFIKLTTNSYSNSSIYFLR
jgi:NADH:ubiquinone oxidoreductase subunit 2 (subunit N)